MAAPTILMCPPQHFGILYEINPWMNRAVAADHPTAARQWDGLQRTLAGLGVTIPRVEPQPDLPDLVFTANAGLIHRSTAYLSRFRHPQRQGEEPHYEAWFAAHGLTVRHLPDELFFEGAGDALFLGETLVCGYRTRSSIYAAQWLGVELACPVLPVELVDPRFYHLDTCFCPVTPELAIWFPDAFDEYGRRAIERLGATLIAVEEDEAVRFACNSVVVGRTVVTGSGCEKLHAALAGHGFAALGTPTGEFLKAGGSAKCLTLRLDGEEAAAWKATPA